MHAPYLLEAREGRAALERVDAAVAAVARVEEALEPARVRPVERALIFWDIF
jgi:hypothetical protein